ncbi:polymerase [Mesorhizobium atlanticum]
MRLGDIIANTFAAILVICGLALIFLVAGRPLFPRRQARMVVLLPDSPDTTASIPDKRQQLPAFFNLALAPRKPSALQ